MTASDRSYNEKRDFIRMKINSKVRVQHAGKKHDCICKDLSGTGISLLSTTEFLIGDDVEILIDQESESHLPFHALTQVTRVQADDSGNFLIGLSIKQIHD